MKEVDEKINETELRRFFPGSRSVQRSDLRKFYAQYSRAGTDQAFRRFLYRLEKEQVITPVGGGVYVFHDPASPADAIKRRFSPTWSKEILQLNDAFQKVFPYTRYLLWETRVLHEFMLLQPGQNFTILETERDVCESAFNLMRAEFPGRVFLKPDREIMERYVLPQGDSILIYRLVTEAPRRMTLGIPSPKLEKILVDLFANKDRFFYFQGAELTRIFENALSIYWVSGKTLFRYARRRKVSQKLQEFIREQTHIAIPRFMEEIE